jgi:hypothetical protein
MTFQQAGWRRGAWIVRLGGRERAFVSSGRGFPELDSLYVPMVPNPSHWEDYTTTLVLGAIDKLVGELGKSDD